MRSLPAPNLIAQHLCGREPVGQYRGGRHAVAAGAGLLPLLPAKGGQWQCAQRHAVPGRRQCRLAVLFGRAEHDRRRRLDQRLPGRRAIRPARHPDTSTHAYGGSLQLTDTGKLFDRDNHFVVGASLDIGRTQFNAASFVGGLTSADRSFVGPGVVIDEPGTNSPVSVAVDSAAWGFYFADTWRITPRLALTAFRPPECRDHQSQRSQRAATSAARTTSCTSIPPAAWPNGRALAHGLWRLRRRQPHADPGRTLLRRPGQFLQPRQFLRRRSGPEAGGVAHLRSGPAGKPSGLREGPPALQSGALSQRPRRRHRLHQQPHTGPSLLRQYRQHAPPGPRRRAAAHHRALAGLYRLFLHRRHVPEHVRRSLRQQPGGRSQRQHHRAARQPAARHPAIS